MERGFVDEFVTLFLQFQCKTNFRYSYSFTRRNVSVTDKSFQIVERILKSNKMEKPFHFVLLLERIIWRWSLKGSTSHHNANTPPRICVIYKTFVNSNWKYQYLACTFSYQYVPNLTSYQENLIRFSYIAKEIDGNLISFLWNLLRLPRRNIDQIAWGFNYLWMKFYFHNEMIKSNVLTYEIKWYGKNMHNQWNQLDPLVWRWLSSKDMLTGCLKLDKFNSFLPLYHINSINNFYLSWLKELS
jgi:hypothetical protein